MVSNFPPGAAGDKQAPYNKRDPEMRYELQPKYYEQDIVIFDKGYE